MTMPLQVPTAPLVAESGPAVSEIVPVARVVESHSLLQAAQSLLYIIVIAIFIITFAVQPFRIPSESMEPTLLVGDFLLVAKQQLPFQSDTPPFPSTPIRRGDIIVFRYPVDPSLHLVKRVVGLPGDHLRLRGGRLFIDGVALKEPYAVYRVGPADSYRDNFPRLLNPDPDVNSNWWIEMKSLVNGGELTVPPHSFFVLGDNRNDSEDSRYWGFVPASTIVGKPLLIYFSLRQASRDEDLSNGPSADSNGVNSGDSGDRGDPVRKKQEDLLSLLNFARWDRTLRIVR